MKIFDSEWLTCNEASFHPPLSGYKLDPLLHIATSVETGSGHPGLTRFTIYPGLTRFTIYPGLTRFTIYPGLTRFTIYPGLTRFTIYPGLTRIGSREKRNCSFDDVELINAIA